MKQSRSKVAGHIAKTTLAKGSSKQLAKEVAAYLLNEKRSSELDSLMRDVQASWAEAGVVEAIASSAHPLDAVTKKQILSEVQRVYPEAKKIVITEQHDPEVIGGVRIQLPNKQLDLTVEAKLNQFKQLTNA